MYFTNTAPAYRIPLFEEIDRRIDVEFVFTDMTINNKIYYNDVNYSRLNKLKITRLEGIKQVAEWLEENGDKFDVFALPPLDSSKEYLKGIIIYQ